MSKFKKGDKVVRIEVDSWCGGIKKGNIYTVSSDQEDNVIRVNESTGVWNAERFELVKDENTFDFHKNPWFIRTPTPEAFKAAQQWAFEKGFSWSKGCELNDDGTIIRTDLALGGNYVVEKILGCSNPEFYLHHDALEIKVDFKTVVDKVEYPVKIDPKKAEIQELEKVVEDALQKIRNLKGE